MSTKFKYEIRKFPKINFGGINRDYPNYIEINFNDQITCHNTSSENVFKIPFEFKNYIAIGNMQSYGPLAVPNDAGIALRPFGGSNKIVLNIKDLSVTIDADVSISELYNYLYQRHFTIFVAPGAEFATIGGCIAADVHGKNGHIHGSFGDHVLKVWILNPITGVITCYKKEDEIFRWTVGGGGVTGIIIRAVLRVRPLPGQSLKLNSRRYRNSNDFIKEFFDLSELYEDLGAWFAVDSGKQYFKTFFANWEIKPVKKIKIRLPKLFSSFLFTIGSFFIWQKLFFIMLYRVIYLPSRNELVDPYSILFPLNQVGDLRTIFGSAFIERQFLIPTSEFQHTINFITKVSKLNKVILPFCAVKLFRGSRLGHMSFSQSGISISIQYCVKEKSFDAAITDYLIKHNFPEYIAKMQIKSCSFPSGYPKYRDWLKIADANKVQSKMLEWFRKLTE